MKRANRVQRGKLVVQSPRADYVERSGTAVEEWSASVRPLSQLPGYLLQARQLPTFRTSPPLPEQELLARL
jgi:hypothetical protein